MKLVAILLFCVSTIALAQSPAAPTIDTAQKLATRDAQHKLDAVEKQIANLNLQFEQLRSQASAQLAALQAKQKDLSAAVDAEVAKDAKVCGDEKKWKLDAESLTCTAIPEPAKK